MKTSEEPVFEIENDIPETVFALCADGHIECFGVREQVSPEMMSALRMFFEKHVIIEDLAPDRSGDD